MEHGLLLDVLSAMIEENHCAYTSTTNYFFVGYTDGAESSDLLNSGYASNPHSLISTPYSSSSSVTLNPNVVLIINQMIRLAIKVHRKITKIP